MTAFIGPLGNQSHAVGRRAALQLVNHARIRRGLLSAKTNKVDQ
jgi:hypothetical protein